MKCLIVIASFTETAQGLVRYWLLCKACGVQRVLKVEVKHQVLNDLIIRIVKKLLDDERANYNIHRCIRPGGLVTIQNGKAFFIYRRKNLIGEDFRPGFFQSFSFPFSQGHKTVIQ